MPSEITALLSSITLPGDLAVPAEVYELIAQAARYWFLLLMAIIVWRSFRWYRRDRRQAKKRLKLLPDAGFVGEMVVIEGGAASEFYKDGKYQMEGEGLVKTSNQMVDYLAALCEKYPIVSIEDGLAEDDWKGWKALIKTWKHKWLM